jgi:predicted CXXCH cytochrome family protein
MAPVRVLLLVGFSAFTFAQTPQATFVGSQACKTCHAAVYDRWSKTRMANVVVDPKVHPEAILPDLTKPNPLVTFKKEDIAFTYGSKWKQRYFQKVGDDYFPLPAQWDIRNQVWRAYTVAPNTDWWVPHYPGGNAQRPTGPLCDGCHSVNYDIQTKTVTEWNVGCEKCHGPGSEHVRQPSRASIVNPTRLNFVAANDVCMQCHTQGQPLSNPINGKYYDWPVGYRPGLNLKDFWKLEEHKLGETSFTHFADGTAHKNRMQGNDFVQSQMYTHGVSCFSCHDVHGTGNNADLVKPANVMCLECHGPQSPNGPRAATIEEHTHHKAGSAGNECVSCHMPSIQTQVADVTVRAHTFKFIPPSATTELKVPNACNTCHKDQTAEWATNALKTWGNHSPWRVAQ